MSQFSISQSNPADYETVIYEVDGPVAIVSLNRPNAMNSFNTLMRSELAGALMRAKDDDAIRVVILTGVGRAFSAGADLKAGMPEGSQTVKDQLRDEYLPSIRLINDMDKPVMAALNGPTAGIALGYALNCDLAVMSEDAYLLSPFAAISLVADGGINWQLARRLGYKKAYEVCVEGQRMPAALALEWGLVNKVVPADALMSTATEWAHTLSKQAPLTLAATKRVMRFAMQNTWQASFDLEAEEQVDLLMSPDNVEGVAAFLEKRSPVFKG
ncbi:MAG: enoyl-CoA hydratase/isomerase family protein [Pseudomonadota bacterium]